MYPIHCFGTLRLWTMFRTERIKGGLTVFRKKLSAFLSGLVILSLVLSACTGGKQTNKGTDKPADPPPAPAKKQPTTGGEIVYQVPDDPDTLATFWLTSSYAAYVTTRVFGGGLLRIGYDLKPEPNLAESYTVSEDQKTYTFKLRQGVKFHDGKPVTSADIKFSYDVLMHKDYTGPSKSVVRPIASVEAPDANTIVIKTTDIFAPFLFGSASVEPLPKHILGEVPVADLAKHDFWKKPIGAGPWKFVEWKTGQYVLLERNPEFWETGKPGVQNGVVGPYIDRIRVRVIKETNTAVAALEAGELTYMTSVDPNHADRLKVEQKDKLTLYQWDRMGYGYQMFNNEIYPTNIKAVRQALSHSLDRAAILKGILNGQGTVPPGFVPPVHWAFDKTIKGYDYDPAKAEKLLQDAGFKKNSAGIYEKDGKPLKLKYVGTKGSDIVEGIALQSQKDWGKIGIEVELVMVDFNTLLDKHMKPGDYHVTFSGLGFTVDPHYSFDAFHSRNIVLNAQGVNSGTNRARYKNAKVDELVDQGMKTVDVNKRLAIYHEAQKIIVDDAAANWIYVNLWSDFVRKDVKGVVNWNGYGVSYMNQWYMNEK